MENGLTCPGPKIRHSNQGALGKWEIQEGGANGEGRAQADLVDQKEWGDGPELVEGEDERENLAEFFAEALVVEAYGGEQVQAQRDADAGGNQDGPDEDFAPGVADGVADFLHVAQEKQG